MKKSLFDQFNFDDLDFTFFDVERSPASTSSKVNDIQIPKNYYMVNEITDDWLRSCEKKFISFDIEQQV